MTAGTPWSVKGINPKAREVAKDLARRSGMTLGEWLNRVILEDDVPEEIFSEADFQDRPHRLADAPRVRLASVAAGDRPDDLARVAQALDRLTDRIEASETRTGLAISGIEHSVRQAVARIEATERAGLAIAARLEQVSATTEPNARDAAGPRSDEALRAIYGDGAEAQAVLAEEVAGRLAARLSGAEARTADAVQGLRSSLAALDARLGSLEGGATLNIDHRLEALAADLGERVEAARAEAIAKLQASGAGSFEARLAEMAGHVRVAEQRSAQAIERMGREVLALAEALNRRLASAEQQSATAVEQVGGEIARIGAVVESRLTRTEQAQADALEKLGAEIGRVTERLTERVAQSERRTAQAIDDVGEQVVRITERMETRHERMSDDFAERIAQSEARTAQLLESTRGELAESLASARERLSDAAADDPPPVHAFGPELYARAEIAEPELNTEIEPEMDSGAPVPIIATQVATPDDFAPLSGPRSEAFHDDDDADSEGADRRPLSTREVIEQARIAARAETSGAPAARVAQDRRVSGRPGARGFGGLGFRTSARPPSSWQTALMLAGGAAFLSVGAAGVVLMEGPGATVMPEIASANAPAPRAAVALAPQPLGPTAPAPGEVAAEAPQAPAPQPAIDYAAAVRDIESGQAGGLSRLKVLADGGFAPAQFYLAKLYETGLSGVIKNLGEARKWTERAAEGGDRSAMHNLALYYFRGEGGPQNLSAAAKWFKQAAQAGVVDSQYNLGLLYESGSGVDRDLGEAYKWFTIAAAGGDAQARANAVELEAKLDPAALAAADKAAASYRPHTEIAAQAEASGSTKLASAQRVLGKLGYYRGAANGAPSSDLTVAVRNFQRDHELAATGSLDPNTISQLSVFTR